MYHYECVAPNIDRIVLQRGRFWATSNASFRERFNDSRSCWTVFIHVEWGYPGGLLQFSKGKADDICLAFDSSGICPRWPNSETLATAIPMTTTGCGLKNDPTPKMWYLSNSWKFLRQILYTCSVGSCPLICCFSQKLLYMYKIDIMPNFNFEFCNCTSLFLRDVTFRRIIFKFTGKKMEVELHKTDT